MLRLKVYLVQYFRLKKSGVLALLLLTFASSVSLAQTTLSPNDTQDSIRRRNQMLQIDSLKYKMVAPSNLPATKKEASKDTIIRGNRYRFKNNWINIGGGIGVRVNGKNNISYPAGVGFNFRAGDKLLKVGFQRSEMSVIFGRNNPNFLSDLHLCVGKRQETAKYNLAGFVGVSRGVGLTDSITKFTGGGLYAELQATKKIFFDIGYGLTLFTNINKNYPMVGLRLDFYFSNSYRGKAFH